MHSNMNIEDSLDTIEAMLRQEATGYTVPDYMRHLPKYTKFGQPIDAEARFAIAEWCVKIMDICHYSRETAAIAMSCLDRFVSTPAGYDYLLDRRQFQLASLSAVYTAVKIHEHQALAPHLVAKLSQGTHSKEDIESTERQMLQALKWKVNPPTSMDFVRKYLDLIPPHMLDGQMKCVLLELSQFQIDLSVVQYEFCTKKSSLVAKAALMNAVESIFADGTLLFCHLESLVGNLVQQTDLSSFGELRDRLYTAISQQGGMVQKMSIQQRQNLLSTTSNHHMSSKDSHFTISPRSVHMSE